MLKNAEGRGLYSSEKNFRLSYPQIRFDRDIRIGGGPVFFPAPLPLPGPAKQVGRDADLLGRARNPSVTEHGCEQDGFRRRPPVKGGDGRGKKRVFELPSGLCLNNKGYLGR